MKNKSKNISESFEEYASRIKSIKTEQTSQIAAHAKSPLMPARQASTMSYGIDPQFQQLFTPRTQALLENFTGIEQKKILKFWYDITTCFGQGRVRQEFGDEPDRKLMSFAASLDMHSYKRLVDNIAERLAKGQEWPPSISVFETLTRTPTDKEILEARTNILTLKKPLSRVEQYISKRKSAKLRTLSEKYMVHEFKTLYLEAFEDVIIYDRDTYLDEKENEISHITNHIVKTEIDIKIDNMIKNKEMEKSTLGKRLDKLNELRKEKMKK